MKVLNFTGFYRLFNEKTFDGLHAGVDLKGNIDDKIFAFSAGKCLLSGDYLGYGGLNPSKTGGVIFILHDDGIIRQYGHIKRLVETGMLVKAGQLIGTLIDFTNKDKINGLYHAPHLHYALWKGGEMPSAPWGYVKDVGKWIEPMPEILNWSKNIFYVRGKNSE